MGLFSGIGFSSLINGKSKALGGIYTRAYNDLIREMNDFGKTPFARERATAMLARVDDAVRRLDTQTKSFVQKEVPAVYFIAATDVKKDIRKLNMRVPEVFSQVHFQATEAAASDAMLKFGHTMTGIKRSAEEVVKFASQKATREIIAAGQLRGAAAKELSKEVQGFIDEQGITALIDRGGKKWQLDTYAEMLTRQVLSNSGREGVGNTAAEFGLDLAIISTHGSAHQECRVWEGKIISLTGKTEGYPTLEEVTDAGLFHVGCKHGYTITTGIGKKSPAKFQAILESEGGEGGSNTAIPFPDAKTKDAFEAMKYEPGDKKLEYLDERVPGAPRMPLKNGELHRWIDDQELQSIIDTGKLSTTPENKALEASGGFFGRPGHKDFSAVPDGGKMFLETLQSTSTYKGTGMHHLTLHVDDIPKGIPIAPDTRTTSSVSFGGSIPMKKLSIVESDGSRIIPGAHIDWTSVEYPER